MMRNKMILSWGFAFAMAMVFHSLDGRAQQPKILSDSLLTYIKAVQNPHQYGFRNQRYYPYSTRYGQRMGWGLPISDKSTYHSGISMQQADSLLNVALKATVDELDAYLKKTYPKFSLATIGSNAQQILIDRAFTEGVSNLSPAFCKAVLAEDWNSLINGYLYIRQPEGWPDTVRNVAFAQRWIFGITGKPLLP